MFDEQVIEQLAREVEELIPEYLVSHELYCAALIVVLARRWSDGGKTRPELLATIHACLDEPQAGELS